MEDLKTKPLDACCDNSRGNCCFGKSVDALNEHCFCVSLDQRALRSALAQQFDGSEFFSLLEQGCPYVFAARPVFISRASAKQVQELVTSIESVVNLPAYQDEVLKDAPAVAKHVPKGTKSVFFGYDFHVHDEGVALIEINTNAGGAMLNAVLAKAQKACCAAVRKILPAADGGVFEKDIVAMFQAEWQAAGHARALQSIAIVDERPKEQYLYPEFLLFQRLFEQHGIQTVVVDPAELIYSGGVLSHHNLAIDLVYNRLTDFMLEQPDSAALREAYLGNAVVLTPHPRAHALYANKRNLVLLSDREVLSRLGVPTSTQEILVKGIPKTELVGMQNAERLWYERRHFFFKPSAGFGSRAAYRGDKLTKRVWEEIIKGGYVAQALVAPPLRASDSSSDRQSMKFDLRAYAYDGQVQWFAARLYQGQTTNFRTPGGGFAPVYAL